MFIAFVDYDSTDPGGALHTLRDIMLLCQSAGHAVIVIDLENPAPPPHYKNTSIQVIRMHYAQRVIEQADVFIAPHHPVLQTLRGLNRHERRPIISIVNFADKIEVLQKADTARFPEAVVYMSRAMERQLSPLVRLPSVVYHPHINPAQWAIQSDKTYITLINCNETKGGAMAFYLAELMPECEFLLMRAYYGRPIECSTPLKNVTYINNGVDLKTAVYGKTRILLMPSRTESWGRVANEAMCSGIPVLYSRPSAAVRTQGLAECVGVAEWGLPDDAAVWAAKIRALADPDAYEAASARARQRADELWADQSPAQLLEFITSRAIPKIQTRNPKLPQPAAARNPGAPAGIRRSMISGM